MSAVQSPQGSGRPASLVFHGWGYKHASRAHFSVRDFSLSVPAGQRVLLLGASGIGKSTILRGAAGLLGAGGSEADDDPGAPIEDADGGLRQGRITVDGLPADQALGRVGLVLQDPDAQAIFQRVGDNVAFGPENMGLSRDLIWRKVEESMAAVGLADLQRHRSVTHLSGGQMQRLALAGALAMEPGVLLLDEPTANLDPAGVGQVVGAVRAILDRRGSTMVLVEHRAGPWIDMIDRVVVLGLGQEESHGFRRTVIMADGTPDEVFHRSDLDFASLGIWVPERYARPGDRVNPIHSQGGPGRPAAEGKGGPLLSVRSLAVGRGSQAIADGINLDFRPGQITALVGDNGAGKSTLAMTLAGLLKPLGGRVEASPELLGADGPKEPDPISWSSTQLASRISYVFQNPEHQFARGSVLDEVMLAPERTGLGEGEARERAWALLDRFHLGQYAHANPYTLSGGEKRRLTVASALAAASKVLILDEPTFGQDRVTWTNMAELIAGLRGRGVSIIVVTHDRQLVGALGARVVELRPRGSSGSWNQRSTRGRSSQVMSNIPLKDAGGTPPARPGHSSVPHGAAAGMLLPVKAMKERTEEPRRASRSPYVASLNPSFRLIGAFLLALPLLFSLDWLSALTALGLETALLMLAGFTPRRIVRSSWPLFVGAPGSAIAVLLYGKSGGAVLWHWGLMLVTERSAALAAATALRVLAIGIPAIIMMLGVDATDLADSFSQVLHLPDRFVYGGLAGLRLFSVLRDDWTALSASRRSRGLGDESRVKAFLPQAFALLVLSIRRSTTLSEAMEARGFGGVGPRSHARVSVVRPRDWVFLTICLCVPVISLGVAWACGTFAFFGN
ncbi:ATP-binding cassette domain-containing protein [Bifidobacterium xylocopae]|uniref:ABC transporter ATP-binding protein n=1 Tax=Bifidobacterium xylocopae TaxID=2493119 RepID=A0A366KE36_9BIFI|nr:ATP-binding cassette domain-containing protein [Bifidobacterium xylocopae]RBP99970.1 ABC transporter ATP-binding protein [Bifidobacterium xylocopae]